MGGGLAVTIPEGAAACEAEWIADEWDDEEKVNGNYIRTIRAQCFGTIRGAASSTHVTEIASPESALLGLRLRRTVDALKAHVRAVGGSWIQAAPAGPAEIVLGDQKVRVLFAASTGLSREIILYGPPWPPKDPAFYASIISRFGFPRNTRQEQCSRIMWGVENIEVEWRRTCSTGPVIPFQEMRLVDMADPESRRDRGK
ncbi:MAG: hypothetical protein EPN20_02995 [Magnetospirillum sp.]|nr:MAG: hypothetical protein EPN20_02995 [Magnetospirillum sp.]